MEKEQNNQEPQNPALRVGAVKASALVVHIDEFANVCGFFNSETPVNNHYGCNHPEAEETEIVKINKGEEIRFSKDIERKILFAALRKEYGSWSKIVKASETIEGKEYINKVRHELMYSNDFIKQFGCKIQGKCYSFSCPLANQCDLEDLKEYAPDLYEDWKDEDYDPSEAGADLMLITDENLIEALS